MEAMVEDKDKAPGRSVGLICFRAKDCLPDPVPVTRRQTISENSS